MQALIYLFYKGAWVLPVAGFLVGYVTNWVALKLIFEPALPWNLGCYTLQGLFLKRQQEASLQLALLCKHQFLVQEQIWEEVFHGVWQHKWLALLERVTEQFVRRSLGVNMTHRVAAALLIGDTRMRAVLRQVLPLLPHLSGLYLACDIQKQRHFCTCHSSLVRTCCWPSSSIGCRSCILCWCASFLAVSRIALECRA
jgi:hypothetical protein